MDIDSPFSVVPLVNVSEVKVIKTDKIEPVEPIKVDKKEKKLTSVTHIQSNFVFSQIDDCMVANDAYEPVLIHKNKSIPLETHILC